MGTIQIRTEIPGPKSKVLMDRRNAAVARGPFHATPVFVAKAEGAVIEDVDGNRFIDFAGGIGCLNIGHRDAVRELYCRCGKAECADAGKISEEDRTCELWRRSRGERYQNCARLHETAFGDLF